MYMYMCKQSKYFDILIKVKKQINILTWQVLRHHCNTKYMLYLNIVKNVRGQHTIVH